MDGGARQATVQRISESQTQLSDTHTHTHTHTHTLGTILEENNVSAVGSGRRNKTLNTMFEFDPKE